MKSSRWLWATVGIAALLATVLFVGGFAVAVKEITSPRAASGDYGLGAGLLEPTVPEHQQVNEYRIVALGDSLTKGMGDASGRGYVGMVMDKLTEQSGKKVKLVNNLAVNGYRTDQLLSDLQNKPGIGYSISQANLILLTIGGNDLAQLAQQETGGSTEAGAAHIDAAQFAKLLDKPAARLKAIVDKLKELNSKATIVYVGLYNPYFDLDESLQSSLVVTQWNVAALDAIRPNPNMMLVPSQDLFEYNSSKLLADDHFHPNEAGYERIAERIVQLLL